MEIYNNNQPGRVTFSAFIVLIYKQLAQREITLPTIRSYFSAAGYNFFHYQKAIWPVISVAKKSSRRIYY